MEFGLSEEQVMLQDSLARFLAGTGGLERTRTFAAGKDRRAPDVLQGLAELGVTGLIIPEVHGGVGLSLLDAALAAEQLGRFVAPSPFAATAVMAPLALMKAGDAGQQATWLPKLASGAVVAGVALSEITGARDGAGVEARDGRLYGRAQFVVDYEADLYILADRARGLHLVAADAPGAIAGRIRLVEHLGSESLVHVEVPGFELPLIARLEAMAGSGSRAPVPAPARPGPWGAAPTASRRGPWG